MNVPVQLVRYDITATEPSYINYIQSQKDNDVRKFRVKFFAENTEISLTNCTATATITIDNVLIEQELACTITDNSVEVTANATRDGVMAIQITLTDGDDKLTMQRPIFVRVTNDIAETAQIDDDSHGSFAEVVQEIADARGDYISLSEALNHKLSSAAGAVKTANIDTGAVTEAKLATDSVATAKIKDSNVTEAKLAANSVTTAKIKDGNVTEAKLAAAFKDTLYKVDTTARSNITSADIDSKKIYTNFTINYNGANRKAIVMNFDSTQTFIALCADGMIFARTVGAGWQCIYNPNDKTTSITDSNKSSNILFPTIKAVVDYLTANYTDTTALNSALSGKMDAEYAEDIRYKVDELDINIAPDPEDEEYPSAYAAWQIANGVYDNLDPRITGNSAGIADLQAYLGYTSPDILGLCVDLENNRFTRLAGAAELDAGSDFDAFPMFGGRRRCCVANDGTINAYYGEQGYAEDGTNGQVMVYQPKFYYRMVPLKLEKQTGNGMGYHIRKANYYVTANPHPGFKLHPLFYDANGNEVDYVLLSAYEGSMYDVSASAYVNDSVDSITYASGDLLCSVGKGANDSGKKPISGKLTGIGTKANFETMANNRGTGWHLDTIQSVAANQLLMLIELGRPELQSVIGHGRVSGAGTGNASSLTGSTSALGNETGMATKTIAESAGETTECTENGKLSVSYRGLENPWGNIWKHINGINLWGDGTMNGGQAYVCHDFSFNEQKKSENYEPVGFTVSNAGGYISAFGYGAESYDWLFLPSETSGSSAVPVGDRFDGVALNGYKELRLGGKWNDGAYCGAFCLAGNTSANTRHDVIGCRMLYVPTATV